MVRCGAAKWRGTVWVPLYVVMLSSTLLYHFTGLLTGTVVRNRRWAFLVSIGLVFCLYTVIPQMAKFGLVFFKYLTITPVFEESLPGILPRTAGALMNTLQRLAPTVKFFNLDFSEAVFTGLLARRLDPHLRRHALPQMAARRVAFARETLGRRVLHLDSDFAARQCAAADRAGQSFPLARVSAG